MLLLEAVASFMEFAKLLDRLQMNPELIFSNPIVQGANQSAKRLAQSVRSGHA